MVTPELLTYITTQVAAGKHVDDITASLAMSGWSADDIQAALSQLGYSSTFTTNGQLSGKSKRKPILLAVFLIFFLLIFGTGTTAVLGAYGTIPIPDSKIKFALQKAVFTVPFIPKTKEYVLEAMTQAEENVKKERIALTFAVKNDQVEKYVGQNGNVFVVSGPIDFSNQDNVQFDFTVQVPQQLDTEIQLINKILYLKINKLPDILTQFGITQAQEQEIMAHWLSYDGIKNDHNQEVNNTVDDAKVQQELPTLQAKLMQHIVMTTDSLDGTSTYKLDLPVDREVLKAVFDFSNAVNKNPQTTPYDDQFLTDYDKIIKNFHVSMWVDENSYYLRKLSASFVISPDPNAIKIPSDVPIDNTLPKDPIPFDYSIVFTDINGNFVFTPPTNAVKLEDELQKLQQEFEASQPQSLSAPGKTKTPGKNALPTPLQLNRLPLGTNVQGTKTVNTANLLKELIKKIHTSPHS